MHGNVSEWCVVGFDIDPDEDITGDHCVIRGGFWYGNEAACRSDYRVSADPGRQDAFVGFRVVGQ